MVEQAGRVDGVFLAPGHVDSYDELEDGFIVFASDGVAGFDLGRPARVEGRLPDPDAVDEVFLSTRAAEVAGLGVGDVYPARILNEELIGQIEQADERRGGPRPAEQRRLRRAGRARHRRHRNDVRRGRRRQRFQHGQHAGDAGLLGGLRPAVGRLLRHVRRPEARRRGRRLPRRGGGDRARRRRSPSRPDRPIEAQAERAIRPQVAALRVFTLVAGLIGLVIVGQAVSRRLQLDAITYAPLRALGLTERQRASLALARTAVAATAGGLLAVAIAVVASPVAPVGVARDAEPAPGLRVEWVVVIGGAVLVVATVLAIAVWPAIASTRAREPRRQRASASSWVAAAGFAPPVVAGTRFALDPGPVQRPHPLHPGGRRHRRRPGRGHVDLRRQPRQLHRLAPALRHPLGHDRERGRRRRGGARRRPSPLGRRGRCPTRSRPTGCSRPVRSCSMTSRCRPWPSRPSPKPIQPTLTTGRLPARRRRRGRPGRGDPRPPGGRRRGHRAGDPGRATAATWRWWVASCSPRCRRTRGRTRPRWARGRC